MLLPPISLAVAQKTLAMAGTVAHLPHGMGGSAAGEGICVIGEGYVGAPPDVALLDLAVSARGVSALEALAMLRERTAALLRALAGAGVLVDLGTRTLSLGPSGDGGSCARQELLARLGEPARVGDALVAVTAALVDCVEVTGLSFAIGETAPLAKRARAIAIEDARRQAESLARQLGVEAGEATAVREVAALPAAPSAGWAPIVPAPGGAAGALPAPAELLVCAHLEVVFRIKHPRRPPFAPPHAHSAREAKAGEGEGRS